ncbi:MAG: LamB/YcsF family protein, partial [Rhodanobacteraceae bacterium]
RFPIPVNTIDLNADLGESFGAWRMGDDAAVMPHVSSANIACGFHAGDAATMQRTVMLAIEHGVAIGAHPSLPDLQGFGRREMHVTPDEVYALTMYQIGALQAFAQTAGARLHHVKPHGALYNMAARDRVVADAIANAVRDFDTSLLLFGLAGSVLVDAGREAGLAVASEAFCDRRYRAEGSLAPRSEAGAVIEDIDAAIEQALSIVAHGEVTATNRTRLHIEADTLCVHGDRVNAGAFAQRLRAALKNAGLRIAAPEPR